MKTAIEIIGIGILIRGIKFENGNGIKLSVEIK